MRLGISSYTFGWSVGLPGYPAPDVPLTAERLLDKAAGLGVRVLQIADNVPLDRLSDGELAALTRRAASLGISLEVGTAGIDRENLRRYLELASRVGSPILRTVSDTRQHRPTPDEAVRTLSDVLPEFARANVVLALENHDRFRASTLLDILWRVESDHLGICLDTANSIGLLESVELMLETLGQYVVNLHLKDFSVARAPHRHGFIVEGRPAGQGQLDIPGLIARVREFGRDPNAILEQWLPPQPTLAEAMALEDAWASQSVQYLRQHVTD